MKTPVMKIFISLVLTVGAVMPLLSQDVPADTYKVTILVFSGRPNPAYVIDNPEDVKELRTMFKDTATPELSDEYLSQPGYRGLIVEGFSGNKKIMQSFIPAGRSKTLRTSRSARTSGPDVLMNLEKALLKRGLEKNAVPPDFYRQAVE